MDGLQIKYLNNGLRLVFYRLPYRQTVSINVRVDAGTRREAQQSGGIAHFVEHLLFAGTARPESPSAIQMVEALGGDLFCATHTEYTSYWLNVPRKYYIQALPYFLEMLRHPTFTKERIEQEKSVILSELAEKQEEPWSQAQLLLDQALWGNHPLARSTLGREETIGAFTLQQIQDFFTSCYAPERMTIAVVGDIDPAEAFPVFALHWSDWSPSSEPILSVDTQPELSEQPFVRLRGNEGTIHCYLGLKLPPLHSSDHSACHLLSTILGGGMSSRLYSELRDNAGLCYSIECGVDDLRHARILYIYFAAHPENFEHIVERIIHICSSLSAECLSRDEFERNRQFAIGKLLMEMDDVRFHARTLALSTFLANSPVTLDEQIQGLESLDARGFQRVMQQVLVPGNLAIGAIGAIDDALWERCQTLLRSWR